MKKNKLPANLCMTNEDLFIEYLNRTNKASAFHYFGQYDLLKGVGDDNAQEAIVRKSEKQNNITKQRNQITNIENILAKAVSHFENECNYAAHDKPCSKIVYAQYNKYSKLLDYNIAKRNYTIKNFILITILAALIIAVSMHVKMIGFFLFLILPVVYFSLFVMIMTTSGSALIECDFKKIREQHYDFELEQMKNRQVNFTYKGLLKGIRFWSLMYMWVSLCAVPFIAFTIAGGN